jgi:hypothetical protein
MPIKSIMISEVKTHYTAEHIAFILLTKEICHVSSITLIPQIYNEEIYNIAYIDIHSYCDTEVAYEFIEHIKSGVFMLNHDNDPDNVWVFQNNIHNSGQLSVGSYTTNFYYDDNENMQELHTPIQGIKIDNHLVNETSNYIILSPEKNNVQKNQEKFNTFENELRIQYTLNISNNVTLRGYQYERKSFQTNQTFPREIMWRNEMVRSVSDLSV